MDVCVLADSGCTNVYTAMHASWTDRWTEPRDPLRFVYVVIDSYMNHGRHPVPPAADSDQSLLRSFPRPVVCVVVSFCTMAAASASNAMQIVSEANCDLLDNVQAIADNTWVEKRDMIAGPRPAKAIRDLSVQSTHPEFPISCTALGCMPALANDATVNLWGADEPLSVSIFNASYSQTRTSLCIVALPIMPTVCMPFAAPLCIFCRI